MSSPLKFRLSVGWKGKGLRTYTLWGLTGPASGSQTFQLAGPGQCVACGTVEAALGFESEAPQRVLAVHEHVWRGVRFATLSDCRDKR